MSKIRSGGDPPMEPVAERAPKTRRADGAAIGQHRGETSESGAPGDRRSRRRTTHFAADAVPHAPEKVGFAFTKAARAKRFSVNLKLTDATKEKLPRRADL